MKGIILQEEIDESGAGHLDLFDGRVRWHGRDQCLREGARILPCNLGQAHGEIAREIAMGRIARALDLRAHVARRGADQGRG